MLGDNRVVITGGMENMSNVPFYIDKYRIGTKLGHQSVTDGMIKDGLWDVYNDFHMGSAAELCAVEKDISREEQDAFAIKSYKLSTESSENGSFKEEMIPVEIPQRKGDPIIVDIDEEFSRTNFDNSRAVSKNAGLATPFSSSGGPKVRRCVG